MTEQKKRGRPATDRVRKLHIGIRVTEEEKNSILEVAKKNNLTIQQLILQRCTK